MDAGPRGWVAGLAYLLQPDYFYYFAHPHTPKAFYKVASHPWPNMLAMKSLHSPAQRIHIGLPNMR